MRRPSLLLIFALALTACLGAASKGEGVESTPVPLAGDNPPSVILPGGAELIGALRLSSDQRWFGGLSDMVLEGGTVTAINDAGHWWRFRVVSDEQGRPLRAEGLEGGPLGGLDGSKGDGDAEGVAAGPGGVVVSFERRHRLHLYRRGLSAPPERLAAPAGMKELPNNGGVEAITFLPDGRLLLIAEDGADGTSPAWIGAGGRWQSLSYRREGLFRPTAATILPDGDLLVLERRFTLFGGMAARLVRVPASDLRPGAVLKPREVTRIEPPLTVDNMEGLAAFRRPDGRTVAWLLSDDNFFLFQSTLLLAVLLPAGE